ncbi:hypothetical protein A3Q56_01469 [Intoshia linei]|uniref:Uncharacterized protein n=1 Tax=Intoshia linei TaxID=1819745 RepID=A0A177BB66_9BILA|nr:hypothetical protein A3Q56_01469 [Intoshia linei]
MLKKNQIHKFSLTYGVIEEPFKNTNSDFDNVSVTPKITSILAIKNDEKFPNLCIANQDL